MTKQIYWKCVDCSSRIDDNSMRVTTGLEFCYGCSTWCPEVVLAYACRASLTIRGSFDRVTP